MEEENGKRRKNGLRLGSFSDERWAKEMDSSEWIVRQIIYNLDTGEGVGIRDIHYKLKDIIDQILTTQNGGPRFFFSLGGDITLRDWLEAEAETDRLKIIWKGDVARFMLTDYIKRLLEHRKQDINDLIFQMTGTKISLMA